jgi:predicted nucleic acid-binding protein
VTIAQRRRAARQVAHRPGQAQILADTSAWIEYDRATGSKVDRRLGDLIAGDAPLAFTEPILMEVLAGARTDERAVDLRRLLLRFRLLPFESPTDLEGAAHVYRRCRAAGLTPRGMVDCMVAAVAQRTGASLLAQDADLARVAQVIGIELDEASLRPRIG